VHLALARGANLNEAVLPLSGNELTFVSDTNFGSTGRNPNLPDYSDFIVVKVPGIRG
jgi:hypothetical protein